MNQSKPEPFGTLLGYAPGDVEVYSSDYETASDETYPKRSSYRSYVDDTYMGYKWQCVEFARRWLYHNYGYIFSDVSMAYDIFNLRTVRDITTNSLLPFNAFCNGSKKHPALGSLLIWKEGGEFEVTGHVAVVVEVDANYIRVAEQNVGHQKWPDNRNYARELVARTSEDGEYWVTCSYGDAEVLGWMMQTDDDEHAEPTPEINDQLMQIKTLEADKDATPKRAWLNIANNDEQAFVDAMGGHYLTQNPNEQYRYFILSKYAEDELEHATNELHSLFMHATEYVLSNDHLLEKFNLPKAILPKIRKSWDNRLNELITSRFDFSLTPHGLKVYEYNCDSASCYMEAGKVQGKWALHHRIENSRDAGEDLFSNLVKAWRKSHARDIVHIFRDDDPEEKYHAYFMQSAIQAAGLRSKIIVNLDGLRWDEEGNILDSDGEHVRWVWKTWAWETALDQIRQECESESSSISTYEPNWTKGKAPRLSDVLLRENIMVYEPLWSLIPSNKAILPVLWSLFPNHPLLLNTSFELTDDLKNTGYVVKPIVGRCGANIALYDNNDNILESTSGDFDSQNTIYQQLWPLPLIGEFYTQVCTFTAAGAYAGSGVRVDTSMVIKSESDCLPLRYTENQNFLQI